MGLYGFGFQGSNLEAGVPNLGLCERAKGEGVGIELLPLRCSCALILDHLGSVCFGKESYRQLRAHFYDALILAVSACHRSFSAIDIYSSLESAPCSKVFQSAIA